ncbi:MAG TPA: KilA-N domain-containing protein, partial [Saprospiraceae bacterium]|nr:KilA-N domain-containing protein [Saprospiraceae bacterium]
MKKSKIIVEGTSIAILPGDFFSLTDIARKFNERTDYLITNWLRSRATIEFLGTWEILNNPVFNPIEFDGIKNQAGANTFILTVAEWVKKTNATGIHAKPGRYGGTYAHRDIAFEFLSFLSPTFKLYVIQEFQRLKQLENPEWDMRRALAKVNYQLHTRAVRQHIVPSLKGKHNASAVVALSEEADLLNLALFGLTAEQWRAENAGLVAQGLNIRDTADIYQLLVLANLEAYNETLIHYQMSQEERLYELQKTAARQLEALYSMNRLPLERLLPPFF